MKLPTGYLLPDGKTMQNILRANGELLANEGIDQDWPPFDQRREDSEGDPD